MHLQAGRNCHQVPKQPDPIGELNVNLGPFSGCKFLSHTILLALKQIERQFLAKKWDKKNCVGPTKHKNTFLQSIAGLLPDINLCSTFHRSTLFQS